MMTAILALPPLLGAVRSRHGMDLFIGDIKSRRYFAVLSDGTVLRQVRSGNFGAKGWAGSARETWRFDPATATSGCARRPRRRAGAASSLQRAPAQAPAFVLGR